MENITYRNLLESGRPMSQRVKALLSYPFIYSFEDIADFKENSNKICGNPFNLVGNKKFVLGTAEKTNRKGALVVLTNLWANLEPVDTYFSKINARDNTGELDINVFYGKEYALQNLSIMGETMTRPKNSLEEAIVSFIVLKSLESVFIKGRTPAHYEKTKEELTSLFSAVNTRIGTLVGFYSFSDRNIYLKTLYPDAMKRKKRQKKSVDIKDYFPSLSPVPAFS